MPETIGNNIDRLISIEFKNRAVPYDTLLPLYEAARREGGGRPLCLRAAEGLVAAVGKGDVVFIMTGAGCPPWLPKGENDGPPGAAALARALHKGLGAVPVYVCEANHRDPIVASSEAAHIMVRSPDEARQRLGAALAVAPTQASEVAAWAAAICDEFQPKAVISIERVGPSEHGIVHSATGWVLGPELELLDLSPVVDEAAARGVFSVGIGDYGNEVGFGRIHDEAKEIMPFGRESQTEGSPGGNVCAVKTDVLIPAMISNWGAYGVEAALAFLLGNPDLMHGPEMEGRLLRDCLAAGGLEAMNCSTAFSIDNCEGESSQAIVQLLGNMVRLNLQEPDLGVAH
ncbi:MAG TPA: DUF4392 domain-containing protein [Alphaproteobacteria bacterium]|jgi:hypothetical protein|nr:DUF4392 domain-containing protein [Alphaproteobacteria bacterium]MDP6270962.1 DUF4392 domain-containing protein [Alphaproteobacteria bacterium]HJM51275.1 DUF4392 domain-containing protein [Alphaproteobacteria bacterium]